MLFDRGRRGPALKDFDICGDRDRFDVFEVLVTGTLTPGEKLLNGPVLSGPAIRVADRHGKKLEELFLG